MSLHTKSLLVSLSLSGIASSRIDKDLTARVLRDQSAREDAGRWTARLWPKEALDPIRSIDTRIRAYHHGKTLPWLDNGSRLITTRAFTDWSQAIRDFRFQREELVRAFLDHWDHWLDRAAAMRGTAFRLAEYPTQQKAAARFRLEVGSQPIPSADDFRVTLSDEEMHTIRGQMDQRLQDAATAARRDLYSRIARPITSLIERLADPEARFTEASLNAIREIAEAIPELDAFEDPAITALHQRIQAQLCTIDPADLKASRSDRSRAVLKANSILASMAPWLSEADEEPEETPSQSAA